MQVSILMHKKLKDFDKCSILGHQMKLNTYKLKKYLCTKEKKNDSSMTQAVCALFKKITMVITSKFLMHRW